MRVPCWRVWKEGSFGSAAASSLRRLSLRAERQWVCSPSDAQALGTAGGAEKPQLSHLQRHHWQGRAGTLLLGTAPGSGFFSRSGCFPGTACSRGLTLTWPGHCRALEVRTSLEREDGGPGKCLRAPRNAVLR